MTRVPLFMRISFSSVSNTLLSGFTSSATSGVTDTGTCSTAFDSKAGADSMISDTGGA